jgi:hypothetical protein
MYHPKRMSLLKVIAIAASAILSATQIAAAVVPKTGTVCAKKGITKIHLGKKYTCIKSGKIGLE